jgi:hypothetical protein
VRIGQSAGRRHVTVTSVTTWTLGCALVVVVLHFLTPAVAAHLGSYRSGLLTLLLFAAAALYSLRKRGLRLSVRIMRLVARLPPSLARRLDLMDRLETWRLGHLTVGVGAILPFWWHLESGPASPLELSLELTVVLLLASGFVGLLIQEFLPGRMRQRPGFEVRLEDVEKGLHQLYVEAEESVLGHSEALVQAYLRNVRPLLNFNLGWGRMLWATARGITAQPPAYRRARQVRLEQAKEAEVYGKLLEIAQRKLALEQNGFELGLSRGWLAIHIVLALATFVLIVFHVIGVLYFNGL